MPRSFFITVVYGTYTTSSWSWPMPDWPLLAITPDDRERLVVDADDLADGIDVGAKQLLVNDRAEHRDLGGGRDIRGAEEGAFRAVGHERINGKSTSVPWIWVPQFRLPATTWPRVLTPGRDVLHAG